VPPKHRATPKFRPLLSKISLYTLYLQTRGALGLSPLSHPTYFSAKQAVREYQAAKQVLQGKGAPFEGWVTSGEKWESFDSNGEAVSRDDD